MIPGRGGGSRLAEPDDPVPTRLRRRRGMGGPTAQWNSGTLGAWAEPDRPSPYRGVVGARGLRENMYINMYTLGV